MKKLISVLLSVILILSLAGCSLISDETKGKVLIQSGGVDFECYAVKTSENGELIPGYDMSEVVNEMNCDVPYNDDLTVKLEGERYGDVKYSLYSESLECDYENADSLTLPESVGNKIVKISVTWGSSEKNAGYDCFFRLVG